MARHKMTFGEGIEDYVLSYLLGKGGFASVYRGICLKNGLEVAIKKIDKSQIRKDMEERVRQEIAIHYQLKHPSIVELYTFFEDKYHVYLVLELCDNGELQQYVRKSKKLSESKASNFMKQIVKGVMYLHKHNIMHRDVSLSNLLLTKDMHVKIADFGLATQISKPNERHMTMCGTPNFISPEVATGGSHGLETDIWGLGILLYTMLVGSPPFDTEAVRSTLTRAIVENLQLPPYLSLEAKDLIARLLQKNPKDRIRLVQILDHPFIKSHCYSAPQNMSKLTEDSGILTMSKGRGSTFSDNSAFQCSYPNFKSTHSDQTSTHRLGCSSRSNLLEDRENRHVSCNGSSSLNNKYSSHPTLQTSINKCSACSVASVTSGHNLNYQSGHSSNRCSTATNLNCAPAENDRLHSHSPIQSYRLRPIRSTNKNAIFTILDSGEVCLELIKVKGVPERATVRRVYRISADGLRIIKYEPGDGKGVPPSSHPPPLPLNSATQIYSFETLPKKEWSKYLYAAEFVEYVRGRTPKVTWFTDKAKCFLMENGDFEANFYAGGKVAQSSKRGISIADTSGQQLSLGNAAEGDTLKGTVGFMWYHAQEARGHCISIEEFMSRIPGTHNFPVRIGREPKRT